MPRAFRAKVCQSISDFSVGLIRLDETREVKKAQLGGSGTLIQIGTVHGILTAGHVLKYLKGGPAVGLILANTFRPTLHRQEARTGRHLEGSAGLSGAGLISIATEGRPAIGSRDVLIPVPPS